MLLSESEFQVIRAAGFALAVAAAVGLQRFAPHARLGGNWRVNAALWVVNGVLLAAVCGSCACSVARWATDNGVGVLNRAGVPGWAALAVTVPFLDLISYAWHRANHRLGFLWRFHRVHHSDLDFTVSTGVRFHPGELILSLPLRLAAIVVLGAPVAGVLVFEVVFTLANLIEHGDIDYPPGFEGMVGAVLVTPAMHRRHHTRRRPELDSNFGTIFSFWDRVLRSYRSNSSAERIETGVPGVDRPLSVAEALALPFLP